jgi:hypothetical protein
VRLPAAIREAAGRHPAAYVDIAGGGMPLRIDTRSLKAEIHGHWVKFEDGLPFVPRARVERPVDYDLVTMGHLPVDELHPLVAAALFPAAPPASGPPVARLDHTPVRVRCEGAWHPITMPSGMLTIPHPPEQLRREQALHALGGPALAGCFAVSLAWRDHAVRLPKRLRLLRQELVMRAQHGDGETIAAWLADGLDPHVRDATGRTLLHLLSFLPDQHAVPLLHTLLAAGLDLEARNDQGAAPLLFAIAQGGSAGLLAAMLARGARRDGWEQAARTHNRLEDLWPTFLVVPGG